VNVFQSIDDSARSIALGSILARRKLLGRSKQDSNRSDYSDEWD